MSDFLITLVTAACIIVIALMIGDIGERLDALEAVVNSSTIIRP